MRSILFYEEEYRYEEDRAGTGCRAGSDEHGRLRAGLLRQGQGPAAACYYQGINSGLCKTLQGPAILPSASRSDIQQKAPAGCRGQVRTCSQWRCLIPPPRGAAHQDARTDTWLICVNSVYLLRPSLQIKRLGHPPDIAAICLVPTRDTFQDRLCSKI